MNDENENYKEQKEMLTDNLRWNGSQVCLTFQADEPNFKEQWVTTSMV